MTIESLKDWNQSQIKSVHLLGEGESLEWELTNQGMVIQCPQEPPCEHAFAFKIEH